MILARSTAPHRSDDASCPRSSPWHDPPPSLELNGVLADSVVNTARILGDNFVGAYLQGSFAFAFAFAFAFRDGELQPSRVAAWPPRVGS